jgi:uncharacterized protein (TIGR02246 family)
MKKPWMLSLGAGLGLALVAALVAARPGTASDDRVADVRKSCQSFKDAWNAHDPKAMAAIFVEEDGDILNPMGKKASGREEIEKAFAEEQTGEGMMRESTIEVKEETVRFLSDDFAISDADAVITGAMGPGGKKMPPMGVRVANVWKKVGDDWKIAACRPSIKPMMMPGAPGH